MVPLESVSKIKPQILILHHSHLESHISAFVNVGLLIFNIIKHV